MTAYDWWLGASLVLNLLFIVGTPMVLFIRFLTNRLKTWVIGVNGPPVVRLMRVKGKMIEMKDGERSADLHIDPVMVKTSVDGRPVVFYDRANITQVVPQDAKEANRLRPYEVPAEIEGVLANGGVKLRVIESYKGQCYNDQDHLLVRREDGSMSDLGTRWRRIDGLFLNDKRRSDNMHKLNAEPDGMWTFLERATPMLVIVAIVLILAFWATAGGMAK